MKWPWVPRSLHDESVERYDQIVARHEARLDALLEKYHALKLQGASVPAPVVVSPPRQVDPVQSAIAAKAGTDRRLHDVMVREAAKARQLGMSDVDIVLQIERGVAPDEGIPA